MCGAAVESGDAVGLVHGERRAEECGIVVVVNVQITPLAVELLAYIIAGVHLRRVFQRGDGHSGNLLHRQVDVFPVVSVIRVAVIFNFVSLVVRAARVVHSHDESPVDRTAHGLLVEFLRRIGLCRACLFPVLVLEGIRETLHRLAQRECQDMVDAGKHLRLACLDGCLRLLSGHHPAQLQSVFPQLRRYDFRHAGGVFGRVGLRHRLHRYDTVLLCQVGQTAECTAVTDRILEEELHARVVQRLPGIVYHSLQHQIGLLQLVVEGEVDVRIFHFQRVFVLAGKLGPQHVQSREEPAAS